MKQKISKEQAQVVKQYRLAMNGRIEEWSKKHFDVLGVEIGWSKAKLHGKGVDCFALVENEGNITREVYIITKDAIPYAALDLVCKMSDKLTYYKNEFEGDNAKGYLAVRGLTIKRFKLVRWDEDRLPISKLTLPEPKENPPFSDGVPAGC